MATAVGDEKTAKVRARRNGKLDAEPGSRGLTAAQMATATPPPAVTDLRRAIEQDGGWLLGTYREPVGGNWHILAGIPIEKVEPTPFQRDLCESHVARLMRVIDRMDRFLDPIIAVRTERGTYWTPNGHHRAAALRRLGGQSIVALILPDARVAYQVLALNTEKTRSLRERSLEAIRVARSLAEIEPRPEREFALEFEDPAYLTLGMCYEQRDRFSGGAYHPVLRRVEGFLATVLPRALEIRAERARKLLEIDDAVGAAADALRSRGIEGPCLEAFVVARIDPLPHARGPKASFDDLVEKMLARARRFDAEKVNADQLASASGPPVD